MYFSDNAVLMFPHMGFPVPCGKESACNVGDPGLILGLERSPGEGNGNPLQCSCQENYMDRGAWRATVCGITKSQTRLSTNTFTFILLLNILNGSFRNMSQ